MPAEDDQLTGDCELEFRDLPLQLFMEAQQHADDLVRELFLMLNDPVPPPAEMLEMARAAEEFTRTAAPVRNVVTTLAQAALDRGATTTDIRTSCARAAAPAIAAWQQVVDKLDLLSRRGLLLTVPASAEVQRFRSWHYAQLLGQLRHGHAAVGWTDWLASTSNATTEPAPGA